MSYGAAAESFREEVRAFLARAWQPGERRGAELKEFIRQFRRAGVERGYLYRSVPKRYGGSEQPVDVIRAQVIREEFARARAPMEVGGNGVNMTVPTLLERGTDDEITPLFRRAGLTVRSKLSTWDDYAIMAMVEDGLGVSILPALILRRCQFNVAIRPLEGRPHRQINAIYQTADVSLAAARFLEYL